MTPLLPFFPLIIRPPLPFPEIDEAEERACPSYKLPSTVSFPSDSCFLSWNKKSQISEEPAVFAEMRSPLFGVTRLREKGVFEA